MKGSLSEYTFFMARNNNRARTSIIYHLVAGFLYLSDLILMKRGSAHPGLMMKVSVGCS